MSEPRRWRESDHLERAVETAGMESASWRRDINGILYVIQFAPDLNAEEVERVGVMIEEARVMPGEVSQWIASLGMALASGSHLDQIGTGHGEEQIRTFLTALLARLQRNPEARLSE